MQNILPNFSHKYHFTRGERIKIARARKKQSMADTPDDMYQKTG